MDKQLMDDVYKIHHILDSKKLESLEVIEVGELTTIADVFIIAIVNNTRASKALSDELEFKLEQQGKFVYRKEGYDTANWILLDYSNIIVHILHKEDAVFYELERLWSDGKTIIL